MRLPFQLSLIVLASVSSSFVQATQGVGSSGGGDSCERRIKEIAADVLNWVELDRYKDLKFSSSVDPADYKSKMLGLLKPGAVLVSCPDSFDDPKYKKIVFEDSQKTCVRYSEDGRQRIDCDFNRFHATDDSQKAQTEQYRLIHHEFAGLAGLERGSGSDSTYDLSDQVTAHLKREVDLKLVVGADIDDAKRIALDTLVATCHISGSTWNFPTWVPRPKDSVDLKIFQADPTQSIWRQENQERGNGLNLGLGGEAFRITTGPGAGETDWIPQNGLVSSSFTRDLDGALKHSLRAESEGLMALFEIRKTGIDKLRSAKKFKAHLTIFRSSADSDDLADLSLTCWNVLN